MLKTGVLTDLLWAFPDAFVRTDPLCFFSHEKPRIRSSFGLHDCKTKTDVACKLLKWLKQPAEGE